MNTGAQIVDGFVSELRRSPGLRVERSIVSRNVFEVSGSVHCLLYIKGRGETPYRWGVTANVVERLRQQSLNWFIVLLYESMNTGYLLSSTDVVYYIHNSIWPLGSDGDYKPASGTYLSRNSPFTSFNEFVRLISTRAS